MAYNIYLPKLHEAQQIIINQCQKYNVICCGRRFGKDIIEYHIIINAMLKKQKIGLIEPTYKMMNEVWRDLNRILKDFIKSSNQSEGRIELKNGGTVDFWSLENYDSIRGRKYHLVCINEAAHSKNLEEAWEEAISATLVDYDGEAYFFSTPNGENYFKKLYDYEQKDKEWKSFHFTSYDNPKLKKEVIDRKKTMLSEIRFRQEHLAEFISVEGTWLKSERIKYFKLSDINLNDLEIKMGCDLAISLKDGADYTAIVVMGKHRTTGHIYILDVARERKNFNEVIKLIKDMAAKWSPFQIGIEAVQYQVAVVQDLLVNTTLNVKAVYPGRNDKGERFQPLLARFENDLVHINQNIDPEFESELLTFPLGKHEDMVDAASYCFNLFSDGGFTIDFF